MRLFLISISLVFLCAPIHGQHKEWVLQFESDELKQRTLKSTFDFELELLSAALNAYQISFDAPVQEDIARERIKAHFPDFILSPNYNVRHRSLTPDDIRYEDQWSLDIIQASLAWDLTTGGSLQNGEEYVIAIMDDGFQIDHPDLINNIWSNPNEIPGDFIDNDGNNYVDDHMGLNIQSQNDDHNIDTHGCRVAGIIGAEGNNGVGIAGINWNTKLLILSNVTNVGEIIKAYDYIYDLKRRYLNSNGTDGANIVVSNFSAGIRRHFPSEFPAWCAAYNLLGSVGILSVAATPNEDYDIEQEGDMPSLCTSPYLVMVTNTNQQDTKVFSAAVSKAHVDLGAPGDNVISTDINSSYKTINGTSAATPHVAGTLGLLHAIACDDLVTGMTSEPAQTALIIKQSLLDGVDSIPSLKETVSGGRLNIYNAMLELTHYCGIQPSDKLEVRTVGTEQTGRTSVNLNIDYTTDSFSPHEVIIVDMMGRLVYRTRFDPFILLPTSLSLTNVPLASGTYVVTIRNDKERSSKKIVVIH